MACHLPGSSVHGILRARRLEWVAKSSSRGSFCPRDRTHVFYVSAIGRWALYHQHHYTTIGNSRAYFSGGKKNEVSVFLGRMSSYLQNR